MPVVDGYLRCLSANHANWREENPLPAPGDKEHGCLRADLLEIARQRRQATAGQEPGSLGLVGGTWKVEPAARDYLPTAAPDSRHRAVRGRRGAIGDRGTKTIGGGSSR